MAPKSKFSNKLWDEIFDRLGNGETLAGICEDKHIPITDQAVRKRVIQDASGELGRRYAQARDHGLDRLAEELLKLTRGLLSRKGLSSEYVQAMRLHVDTLKWYLCKLAPKRYGDQIRHVGHDGGPIEFVTRLHAGRERVRELQDQRGVIDAEYETLPDQDATSDNDIFS